ncbi:MAG: YbjN domain-containing protein [Gemmatimonadota bacterium]|nr:YbjN domain-containing protein [Gemmatimonadota bacterium]
MATRELISENQVTTETLVALFERAFYKVQVDSDGDVVITVDGNIVYVSVIENLNLLRYVTVFQVRESVSTESKLALVNHLNDDYILCRFSIYEQQPDLLIADYYLSFEKGITAFQIVTSLRLFARVAPDAVRNNNESGMIEL